MANRAKTFTFKSEAKELLDLMIHSLYSNKEIFLRELISNASDAIDKRRFLSLSDGEIGLAADAYGIKITTDSEARTVTITDNGVGMNQEELVANLGTIARSGTKRFTEEMEKQATGDDRSNLIGQFGVGFYSAFMVAEKVEVVSRKAGEDAASMWRSTGDGKFQIVSSEKAEPGTSITLHLRAVDEENGLSDFTQEWVLSAAIKKYSDFVQYPIELWTVRTEPVVDEEGKPVEGAEPETVEAWKTLNSMKAIWTRSEADVTEEEYADFYKHISHDWEAPFDKVRFRAEGMFEYEALIFLPDRQPYDLFYREQDYGLQLYVNRVLIKENSDELLPSWLRFAKGVVDSPDLSLNVSREMLQADRRVSSIRKRIAKKVTDHLAAVLNSDRERYEGFWANFGRVLKEGLADTQHADKLKPLLLVETTTSEGKLKTLDEYVAGMKDGQEEIYFMTGDSREALLSSPHLEAFREKDYEVILMFESIDEIIMGHLTTYDEKTLRSVGKGEVELGSEDERKAAEDERKAAEEDHKGLLEAIQTVLEAHVKQVRLSQRLTTSPVCLVGAENDMSPGLERILSASGQAAPVQKRIMELNSSHPIFERLQSLSLETDTETLSDYAHLLHGQALIAEGSAVPDAADFARRVAALMVN
jgi:molecular chaperone HtpG